MYQGIFLRDYLGQTPGSPPGGGSFTQSPDVIPNGAAPAPDPGAFTTPAGYATQFGQTVMTGEYNFVYVRGLNTVAGPAAARVWIYAVPSALALWPQAWQQSGIMVNGAPQGWVEVSAGAANQVLAGGPFEWNPPPLEPSQGGHYLLVAIAENAPLSQPPRSPAPTQPFGTFDAFASWVISNPNVAVLDTVAVSAGAPTWQQVVSVTGPAEATTMYVGVQLTNMPTDGFIAFSVPGPDPAGTVVVPKTPITNPNLSIIYPVNWPPSFSTAMTISYWQGATSPPAGASVTPVLLVPASAAAGQSIRF